MAFRLKPGAANYNFVDLAGKTLAGCVVLQRAPNGASGNAAWWARASCGHRVVLSGIALRAAHKRNPKRHYRCQACRRHK